MAQDFTTMQSELCVCNDNLQKVLQEQKSRNTMSFMCYLPLCCEDT